MATYKAEFLAHYYHGKLRPPSAYAFGLIFYWARLAALAPGLANVFTQTPILRDIGKAIIGVAQKRRLPAFARQTFKAWYARRGAGVRRRTDDGSVDPTAVRVVLWADTFNNYFHPETAKAALEVLESVGCEVVVPREHLCCGRPVYDFGMLDTGKRLLRRILDVLGPEIDARTPIVGLEPSCVSVFRDELPNLFPDDERARWLSQHTYVLSEFLEQVLRDYPLPHLERTAIVHGHCHHKAILGMDDELRVLAKLGVTATAPDAGCCGMAGAFGFEEGDHYDVAMKLGERALLPAVRTADPGTLIVANGFSCREQIAQGSDRQALHLAQVIQMAMRDGDQDRGGEYPETRYADRPARAGRGTAFALLGLGALAAAAVWRRRRAS
jgi:Fe-S oxidoreductase